MEVPSRDADEGYIHALHSRKRERVAERLLLEDEKKKPITENKSSEKASFFVSKDKLILEKLLDLANVDLENEKNIESKSSEQQSNDYISRAENFIRTMEEVFLESNNFTLSEFEKNIDKQKNSDENKLNNDFYYFLREYITSNREKLNKEASLEYEQKSLENALFEAGEPKKDDIQLRFGFKEFPIKSYEPSVSVESFIGESTEHYSIKEFRLYLERLEEREWDEVVSGSIGNKSKDSPFNYSYTYKTHENELDPVEEMKINAEMIVNSVNESKYQNNKMLNEYKYINEKIVPWIEMHGRISDVEDKIKHEFYLNQSVETSSEQKLKTENFLVQEKIFIDIARHLVNTRDKVDVSDILKFEERYEEFINSVSEVKNENLDSNKERTQRNTNVTSTQEYKEKIYNTLYLEMRDKYASFKIKSLENETINEPEISIVRSEYEELDINKEFYDLDENLKFLDNHYKQRMGYDEFVDEQGEFETDFKLKCMVRGKTYEYQGSYVIGNAFGDGGLSEHIEEIAEHNLDVFREFIGLCDSKDLDDFENIEEEIRTIEDNRFIIDEFVVRLKEHNYLSEIKKLIEYELSNIEKSDVPKQEIVEFLKEELRNIDGLRNELNYSDNPDISETFKFKRKYENFLSELDSKNKIENISELSFENNKNEAPLSKSDIELDNRASFFVKENKKTLENSISENTSENTNESLEGNKKEETQEKYKIENYSIGSLDEAYDGGAKTKFRNNIEAIKVLKENKDYFSSQDKEKLSKYVGWGGLQKAFDEYDTKWKEEFNELKNLLTPEEYDRAKESVLTAYYTPPEIINKMYDAFRHFGVTKGNLLEPSCGVGNFIGCIPEDMNFNVKGTEIDNISGEIAKILYPEADIEITGFEEGSFYNNQFNVAIGNIPFGSYKIFDPAYNKSNLLIHDYFINKSLDLVEKGGILALISSKGTLDKENTKARLEFAKKADLVGAIRLPDNAFLKSSNTETTTDILFFKKLDFEGDIINNIPEWVNTGIVDGMRINNYFIENPDMMIGTMELSQRMYGNISGTTLKPLENTNIVDEIDKRIKILPNDIYEHINISEKTKRLDDFKKSIKPFCFGVDNENRKVYFNGINGIEERNVTDKQFDRYSKYLELKEAAKSIIDVQLNDGSDEELKEKQHILNNKFDSFTEDFGHFDNRENKRLLLEDDEIALVSTLETKDKDGEYKKSDFFTERTISPILTNIKANSSEEALILSMDRKGYCDADYMSEISGIDKNELIKELLDKKQVFIEPDSGKLVPSFEYLSGNVVEKLRIAKEYAEKDGSFLSNVNELEKVIPEKIYFNDINIEMGSNLIKPEYIKEFIADKIGRDSYEHDIEYIDINASWYISSKIYSSNNNVTSTYGTSRMNAYEAIERMLNGTSMNIYDYEPYKDESGNIKQKRTLNKKETILANNLKSLLESEFSDFLNSRVDIQEKIEKEYNERFNCEVPVDYKNIQLSFDGLNPSIKEILRDNQKEGIAQSIFGGNTLLAQTTGAGKTFTMIISAMEKKRLGLVNKSAFVLPKHLVGQFSLDFKRCYPHANILITDPKDFEKKNRKVFTARIAQGNYDAVIMSYEQFGKIPLSPERIKEEIKNELNELDNTITSSSKFQKDRISIKNLARMKKSLEENLKELSNDTRKDNLLNFEELGIDGLYVDEAHEYKNMFFSTKLSNIAGVSPKPTKKTQDMKLKIDYLSAKNGGNVVFATATPISNSMSELYTMMRYLQSDKLKEKEIYHFDSWVKMYAKIKESLEIKPTGNGYRYKTRFSSFNNIPELMNMVRQFANIVTADMINLPIPKLKENKRIAILCEPSEAFKAKQELINEELAAIERKESNKNYLEIFNTCKLDAIDLRLLDSKEGDDKNNKVSKASENIVEIYKKGNSEKLTQLVFSDVGTPNKNKFNIYDELKRKLIEQGIPENEIAYIHSADTAEKKSILYEKVRQGEVRVLFGSTRKLGTGANLQDRLVALHHLDVPYRPADLEQREGRILRVGNKNEEVGIYNYVTKNSIESYLWQILEQKQRYISQIMNNKGSSIRSASDFDEATLSFSELKAVTAGNPLIKEKMEVDNEVERLELLKTRFNHKISESKRFLDSAPTRIQRLENCIESLEKDYETFEINSQEHALRLVIGKDKSTYFDMENASKALENFIKPIEQSQYDIEVQKRLRERPKIGSINGLDIRIDENFYEFDVGNESSKNSRIYKSGRLMIERLIEEIQSIPEDINELNGKIEGIKNNIEIEKVAVNRAFPEEQELRDMKKRKAELDLQFEEKENEVVYDTEKQVNTSEILESLETEEEVEY